MKGFEEVSTVRDFLRQVSLRPKLNEYDKISDIITILIGYVILIATMNLLVQVSWVRRMRVRE